MEKRIIIAGFGGQGVLSLGQFIAYAAIDKGLEVTWLPSYGPEMRGGTSNCSVVVSDKTVASPLVTVADCAIILNKPSLAKFEKSVKEGGLLLIDSGSVPDKVKRDDIKAVYLNAEESAKEAGNSKSANIALFGAFCKVSKLFDREEAKATVEKKFANKPKFIPANLKAFDLGFGSVD